MTKVKYALFFLLSLFLSPTLYADADDVRADRDVLDLFDRNEGQVDYNPYDYPSDIEPYNTRSIYWPEMKRIETLTGYQDPYSNQSIHDTIPEMRDKTFTSRINYSPYENGFPQQQLNNQLNQAYNSQQNPQQNPQQNAQNQQNTQNNTQQAQAYNYNPYGSYQNSQVQYGQNTQHNTLYYQTQYQQSQTQYGQNNPSSYYNPYNQQTQNEYYPSEYDNQYYNYSR